MKSTYTKEHLDFFRARYPALGIPDLTKEFNEKFGENKKESQIRAACKNNKIRCGRPLGALQTRPKMFSKEMVVFAKEKIFQRSRVELTDLLNEEFSTNFTVAQVISFCKREKLRNEKSEKFQKGQTSWNSGTIGLMKTNSGSFKPGQAALNKKPFGHERICSKDGYALIKIDETDPYTGRQGRFVHKHRVIWEKANGKIPEGKTVSLIDGNPLNTELSNLELIDKATLAQMNYDRVSSAPEELRPTLRTLSKLKAKMHQAKRSLNN